MANTYDVGDVAQVTAVFTDDVGADVDPTVVICVYTDPSGNATTLTYGTDAALTKSAVGHYAVSVNVDEAGAWAYRWHSTGTAQAAASGYFTAVSSVFTYVPTWPTERDKVRFYLQDTVSGAGPKPADGNFSDAELTALLAAEGSWQRAVAAGFETLAAAWYKYPTFTADGLTLNRDKIANGFAEQAKVWRAAYGTAAASRAGGAGSRATTRVDGYSSTITNQET
jgi:hypothetical protein